MMKPLKKYIIEKILVNKNSKYSHSYNYHPKNKYELRSLLEQLLKDRGSNADLNDIDVSKIPYMNYLFFKLDPHNIDISEWNVSNVKNMYGMFRGCTNFNSDISNWDVSNIEDMTEMFRDCDSFNSNLSKWNVSQVKYYYNFANKLDKNYWPKFK